uniref:Uncharacterized protein n=1 Tax=Parastrongyloides trichosuri TaxID=131310 RepID=A0A0N5A6Q5_PARTI
MNYQSITLFLLLIFSDILKSQNFKTNRKDFPSDDKNIKKRQFGYPYYYDPYYCYYPSPPLYGYYPPINPLGVAIGAGLNIVGGLLLGGKRKRRDTQELENQIQEDVDDNIRFQPIRRLNFPSNDKKIVKRHYYNSYPYINKYRSEASYEDDYIESNNMYYSNNYGYPGNNYYYPYGDYGYGYPSYNDPLGNVVNIGLGFFEGLLSGDLSRQGNTQRINLQGRRNNRNQRHNGRGQFTPIRRSRRI